jgi:hypothetical protein
MLDPRLGMGIARKIDEVPDEIIEEALARFQAIVE